ncbi:unnamed protein product [Discosporangium mesarthrocarpum]
MRLPAVVLRTVREIRSSPPAHVINLPKRRDRWSKVVASAREAGLWLHRHAAADGTVKQNGPAGGGGEALVAASEVAMTWDTELNTKHDPHCPKMSTMVMTPTERACAASHAALWRKHRAGELAPFMPEVHPDAVLILEDDAVMQPRQERMKRGVRLALVKREAILRRPKKKKLDSWDICYVGHTLPFAIEEAIQSNLTNKGKGKSKTRTAGGGRKDPDDVVAHVTFAWRLHAYLLTRSAAETLVANMPVSAPADIFVGSMLGGTVGGAELAGKLNGVACLPRLATTLEDKTRERLEMAAMSTRDLGEVAVDWGSMQEQEEDRSDVQSSGTRRVGKV